MFWLIHELESTRLSASAGAIRRAAGCDPAGIKARAPPDKTIHTTIERGNKMAQTGAQASISVHEGATK
jgi:hypothetical protein